MCGATQDRDEATLELSLFAEAFQEMLARDYGERILQALYAERCVGTFSKAWLHLVAHRRLCADGNQCTIFIF